MKCSIKNAEGKKIISDFPEHAIYLHMYQNYKSVELCVASFALPTAQSFSKLTNPEAEMSGKHETMTHGVWRKQAGAVLIGPGLEQRMS